MKLGVHIGYWGLGLTSEDQLEIVQEAERLGYDSVWLYDHLMNWAGVQT